MTVEVLLKKKGRQRMLKRSMLCVVLVLSISTVSRAAIIVAASNSIPEEKAKADIVCNGKNDQIELLASITKANLFDVVVDKDPGAQQTVKCYGRHSVTWLPGDYYLSETLTIPDGADMVINAEGTFFHYLPDAYMLNLYTQPKDIKIYGICFLCSPVYKGASCLNCIKNVTKRNIYIFRSAHQTPSYLQKENTTTTAAAFKNCNISTSFFLGWIYI